MAKKEEKEPITIGLTLENHQWLERFKEEKIFEQMMDGYRFAIAYALNKGIQPLKISGERKKTFINLGSLDPKREIYNAIISLTPDLEPPIYDYAERLAEVGMIELVNIYEKNQRLDLAKIIEESSEV